MGSRVLRRAVEGRLGLGGGGVAAAEVPEVSLCPTPDAMLRAGLYSLI